MKKEKEKGKKNETPGPAVFRSAASLVCASVATKTRISHAAGAYLEPQNLALF